MKFQHTTELRDGFDSVVRSLQVVCRNRLATLVVNTLPTLVVVNASSSPPSIPTAFTSTLRAVLAMRSTPLLALLLIAPAAQTLVEAEFGDIKNLHKKVFFCLYLLLHCCMISMLVGDHSAVIFQLPVFRGGGAQFYLDCQDAEIRSRQPRQPAHIR
jgi:hypothetical protein